MLKHRTAEIHCKESGLTIIDDISSPATSLEWNDVRIVLAYKRDVFATDLICLGFTTSEGTIEVNELCRVGRN